MAISNFLISLSIIVSLLLSQKQIKLFLNQWTKEDKKKSYDNRKRSSVYNESDELLEPTPLMITPEQVKNYDDRPWRPFRWPYHQTMSIYRLDINHWLDMDKYYWHYIKEKERIWFKYGKENIDWLPEGFEACFELMETVVNHMIKRYPLLFTLISDDNGKVIRNELTKEVLDMTLPLKEHPLIYVSKIAKEDFYVVLKNPETQLHYLVAAAVPFPGGSFGIDKKLGKNLDVIHNDVPYYKEKLQKSMEKWFDRMTSNSPVERASWYMSWDHKLKLNNVYQLPKFQPNIEADLKYVDPKEFNIRVERQTLRRLPKSKAIIFTNHPIFYSIEEMKDEPLIPSLIRKIIYEGPQDIIKYKNFEVFRDHISSYLDGLIKRQIVLGIIKEDAPLKTLPTYPFAHWVKTDFDYVRGWNNPCPDYKKEDNYSIRAREELTGNND